jgi:hypothetical protein
MRTLTFIEWVALHGQCGLSFFVAMELNLASNRFQQGGEALLILTEREEKGMIKQLEDKKVPLNKIE